MSSIHMFWELLQYRKMGSERKSRLDLNLLGQCWCLTSILLASSALVLPALNLDSLLCYYCPLQHKGKSCPNITSQCLPDQRCSSSRGHYGSIHILSGQGCIDAELCGSHEIISYRGVKYNVSHGCCCKDKCNVPPKSDSNLKLLLGMVTDKMDDVNITEVFKEEPWHSCANYTSSRSSTLPTTAS
uniref:sperm acrosome membrane-associated protein 4-like isoform X1 n=1 Tax=Scatophagus argus TaxID=75038 RepID=UPI001ED7D457|nr:sperm acrosome membrane-associated protein 4-like isoform X1 [Scatophagus argus]